MAPPHDYARRFAVRGVFWREYLDFALRNVPFYAQPVLLFIWTIFFFFVAAPARRAVVRNLAVVLPGSSAIANQARAFRTLLNFAWAITDAAHFKLNRGEFWYEIVGSELLDRLAASNGAIVLTAHMGNYDLGAALFAQKFGRAIRMVRAPEPHSETERHLRESLQGTGEGGVQIAYNTEGAGLSFDLLNAVRAGDIVSIQGDRVITGVAQTKGRLFGEEVLLPKGPFSLALVAGVPIFPLFIVRAGYRRYRVIVDQPFSVTRTGGSRDQDIAAAIARWCPVLERTIAQYWDQWFAFAPIFAAHAKQ